MNLIDDVMATLPDDVAVKSVRVGVIGPRSAAVIVASLQPWSAINHMGTTRYAMLAGCTSRARMNLSSTRDPIIYWKRVLV